MNVSFGDESEVPSKSESIDMTKRREDRRVRSPFCVDDYSLREEETSLLPFLSLSAR